MLGFRVLQYFLRYFWVHDAVFYAIGITKMKYFPREVDEYLFHLGNQSILVVGVFLTVSFLFNTVIVK